MTKATHAESMKALKALPFVKEGGKGEREGVMTRPAKPARCSGKYGPTAQHISLKILTDRPDLDLRAGDTIYASPVMGLQGDGTYYVACKDDDGETFLHFVGEYNRLTKRGKPRKLPLIGPMHLRPSILRDPTIEIRRVDWVLRPSESERRREQERAKGAGPQVFA